jgi:hypothetical protein
MLISLSHIGSSARYWGEEVTLTPLGGKACVQVCLPRRQQCTGSAHRMKKALPANTKNVLSVMPQI